MNNLWLTDPNFQVRSGRFGYILSVGEKTVRREDKYLYNHHIIPTVIP